MPLSPCGLNVVLTSCHGVLCLPVRRRGSGAWPLCGLLAFARMNRVWLFWACVLWVPSLLQFGSLCPLFAVLSEPLMECDIYHLPWWFAFVSLTLSVLRVSGHVYAASACWAVFHNTEGDCILCLFLSCILNAVYRRSREHGGLYYQ